jgi:hypothetical protein
VAVFITALVVGVGIGTVLMETGCVFVVAVLAALAVYRFMLSHYDHQIQYSGIKGFNLLHSWFMHRESRVDHVAIPLTFGALLYTVVFGIFIVSKLLDAAIRAIVSALTFH